MANYRYTESEDPKGNPIGTLEKQVPDGQGGESWVEDMKGYIPYDKEAEKDKEHDIAIADINSKIPEAASEENKLTDNQKVNEDIATSSATHRGTYNLVSDLDLTTSATREQVAAALGTAISEADNNDFSYVEVPTTDMTPTEIARTDRYKFNGTVWAFEFTNPDAQIQSDWNQQDNSKKDYIKNKPNIPVVPTNVSSFHNDAGYLTQQDISGKADKIYVENLTAIMSLSVDPNVGVTIVTTNPEWKLVYTDNENRVLLGKRQNNTWYFAVDLDTILDVIINGYTTV